MQSNVQGINLINQISGFSDAENSQTKALAYTLIALDSNAYTVPDNSVLTRETLRQHLMKRQLENGSFQMLDEKVTLWKLPPWRLPRYQDTAVMITRSRH